MYTAIYILILILMNAKLDTDPNFHSSNSFLKCALRKFLKYLVMSELIKRTIWNSKVYHKIFISLKKNIKHILLLNVSIQP